MLCTIGEQKNERETFVSGFNVAEIREHIVYWDVLALLGKTPFFSVQGEKCDVEMKWSDSLSDYEVHIHFMPVVL